MTDKMQAALTSAIYLSRLTLAGEAVDTDDRRLRASRLYPDWAPGAHAVGDIHNAEEYMIWTDGTIQRCKSDTNYSPDEYPDAWERKSG